MTSKLPAPNYIPHIVCVCVCVYTDTDKALLLMMEAMKGLVKGLQNQFTAIDTTFEDIKENGGGGGGQKEDKKNPYAIVKGDFNAQNVSNKVEEQESRLHEMTVQV